MFQLSNAHKDWYVDGIEDGEQCWRLDVNKHLHVQLFANETNEPEGIWELGHLFIERDTREKGGGRVYYACAAWTLFDDEAVGLLQADLRTATIILADQLNYVMGLPNRPEFCH